MPIEYAVASALLKSEFESEERAGFPRLGRVPDTHVRLFLHYFRRLSKSDGELLKSAIAKHATRFFAPMEFPIRFTDAELLALRQKARAFALTGDWQFTALRNLKMAAGMSRSQHPAMKSQMRGFQMPKDVLTWVDKLVACKATELRKLVKHAFATRFGLAAEHLGGGNWVYRRADDSDGLAVAIDYGGTVGKQLRYAVYLGKRRAGDPPSQLCFESMLGAGLGDWDFITEASADQDVALLVDLVEYVVGFASRFAKATEEGH